MSAKRISRVLAACVACLLLLTVAASADAEFTFSEPGVYPIADKPVPLTIFMSLSAQTDYETNTFTKHIEEVTGVDLTIETCPAAEAADKLNMMLTSGTYPDAFFARPDENLFGVQEGILIDITQYLDKLPNLQKVVDQYPNMLLDMVAVDGKTYFLPGYDNCYPCSTSGKLWMNTKLMAEMGATEPTTTDEFTALLRQFKEAYPGGFPLLCFIDGWVCDPVMYFAGSFFELQYNDYALAVKDDKIYTYANTPEYRETLKYLNGLYAEGLINEDCYTMTELQSREVLARPESPVLFVPSGTNFFAQVNDETYAQYCDALAPLAGPSGHRTAMYAPIDPRGAFAVSNKCKYPEAALRFADIFYTLEEHLNSQQGMRGTFWDYPDADAVGLDGKPAIWKQLANPGIEQQNENWVYRGMYNWMDLRVGQQFEANPDLTLQANSEALYYTMSHDNYYPYVPTVTQPVRTMKFTVDESTSIQTVRVEVNRVVEEAKAAFITGTKDPNNDADWDEYVQNLVAANQPMLMEVYQTAYNRKYGK